MKKILLISLLSAVCILLTVTGTLALITNESTGVNVVTMGNIKIATVETSYDDVSQTTKPFEGNFTLVPGRRSSWIFEVENRGEQEAYIRVSIDKIIRLADDRSGTPDPEVMQFEINDADWEYQDGYYYYKQPLAVHGKTTPLFTAVRFDAAAGNLYQKATATAEFSVSATQVKNNGATATGASGWLNEE